MGDYNSIKEKIINQESVPPSFSALKASFDLFKLDLAKEFLSYPEVVESIKHHLDELESQEYFLVFLLSQMPFSELYFQIKQQYLKLDLVWEKIVELEEIPLRITGQYITGDNQIIFSHDKIQQADILLENKNHPVINSLNKLSEKTEFNFNALLQKGSLFTYVGTIDTVDLDKNIQVIENANRLEMSPFTRIRKMTKDITGVALALTMAVSIIGCGKNPSDQPDSGITQTPPYNNSPDCLIRRADFYNRLSRVQIGMTEEEVDSIVNPGPRSLPYGSFKYSVSYNIMGYDYEAGGDGVVTCEVVQIHYDYYWRYRSYTSHTIPL